MSERPPVDADIRVIWQYINAAEDAAFGRPSVSPDPKPEDWKSLRPHGKAIPPGRRNSSDEVFAERLQMTKAEKLAILADALERQIAQRDKDLGAAQNRLAEAENEIRRERGLRQKGQKDAAEPWRRISAQMEADWVSRDFRRVVAALIRSNVFSTNGGLPSVLDREDAKRSYEIWHARLEAHFGSTEWATRDDLACRLVALDHLMDIDGIWETSQITDWGFYESRLGYLTGKVRTAVGRDGGESLASRRMRRLLHEVHRAEIIDAP
ncbi:UNVERIFIED_ORG: hypothetical protein GGI57_002319 [Rhizobium aethiopicum]